jgi:large subunit ribosomal protein L10
MSKLVKDLITKELQARYGQVENALWVELLGVDGITTNDFRRDLHSKSLRIEIVRNELLRRAVGDGPLAPLAKALTGPAALITGGESAIDAAKAIEDWLPKISGLRLRGALLEGEFLDERAVVNLAKMESKADLLAKVAMIILSPGGKLASAIRAPGANVAGCLKALIEKLEQGTDNADAA